MRLPWYLPKSLCLRGGVCCNEKKSIICHYINNHVFLQCEYRNAMVSYITRQTKKSSEVSILLGFCTDDSNMVARRLCWGKL